MRHSMKPDLRADYKIRLYTGPQNPFFEVSTYGRSDRGCHFGVSAAPTDEERRERAGQGG